MRTLAIVLAAAAAAIQTVLGEALLAKIRDIQENGGDSSDVSVLALQADQAFGRALQVDPSDWEAQFMKAAALAHWPAELNKGPVVVQMLQNLIAQQDATAPQPQYAQTYLLLSQQYQAAGQTDKALQTLQIGASKFPLDPGLQQALNRLPAR